MSIGNKRISFDALQVKRANCRYDSRPTSLSGCQDAEVFDSTTCKRLSAGLLHLSLHATDHKGEIVLADDVRQVIVRREESTVAIQDIVSALQQDFKIVVFERILLRDLLLSDHVFCARVGDKTAPICVK